LITAAPEKADAAAVDSAVAIANAPAIAAARRLGSKIALFMAG
jgi:hypothetical protein